MTTQPSLTVSPSDSEAVVSPRRRRSKEERLAAALAKQQTLQIKIQGLQKEISEKSRKNRSRGLLLLGVVVEQCLQKGIFDQPGTFNRDWWMERTDLLHDKDKAAYVDFIQSL